MEPIIERMGTEVRETIHQVTGLLDLVAEEPVSLSQARYLTRCRESVQQLLRTSNELADLAGSRSIALKSTPFPLRAAVEEIADLMGALAARKGLQFQVSVEDRVPWQIVGDKVLFQEILHKLLDNAIRFTEKGSVALSVTAADLGLDWMVLAFEVADTGHGIAKEVLFSNLQSVASEIPRHGLGLMIVRNCLRSLGGEMIVVSNSEEGTRLRITIPVAVVQTDSPEDPQAKGGPSQPLRLMVAEDSDDSFLLFQSYLKAEGHRITRAFHGAEAVEMIKSGEYNFAVMDVHMPVMDGYTATRAIREWETEQGRARMPVLLISADDLGTQIRTGAAAGCSGYLAKPANKAQVLRALRYYANPARS